MLIVILGTLYSFVLPACTVPDEDRHFARAYKVSNFILSGNSLTEQNERMPMRADVISSLSRDYDGGSWIEYYKSFFATSDENVSFFDDLDVIGQSPQYYQYIYSGIVVSLCRVLHLGAHMLLFVGREFNLLLFSGLIFLSIRIFPQMTMSITMLSLFPMTLVLAASYSYDSIIISSLILLFSMAMRCIKDSGYISVKDQLIISVLYIFAVPIKLVYFPVIMILFCINRKKFVKPWHKYAWILAISIITIMIIVFCHGSSVRYYLTKQYTPTSFEEPQTVNNDYEFELDEINSEHIWTMTDVKSAPLEFVGVLFRSLFNTSNQLFMNISGYYFGWFSYEIPITIACIFPILFAVSVGLNVSIDLRKTERLVAIIIVLSSFFLIMLSMLLAETPYGFVTVRGAQGRYFIPLIPFIALLFNRRELECHEGNEGIRLKLIRISVMMNSVVILYLLNDVLFA